MVRKAVDEMLEARQHPLEAEVQEVRRIKGVDERITESGSGARRHSATRDTW